MEAPAESSGSALIFTTPGCPFCRRAKNVLREKGIEYQEIDVSTDPNIRSTVQQVAGRKTVPVVYVNGVLVGGADDLDQVIQAGDLESILQKQSEPLPEALASVLEESSKNEEKETETSTSEVPEEVKEEEKRLEAIATKMRDPKQGVKTKTELKGLTVLNNVFTGAEALDWLLHNGEEDYESALRTGTALQERHYLHHIEHAEPFTASPSKLYMFVEEEAPISSALNARKPFLKPARSATQVAGELRRRILELYDEALSKDGKSVSYSQLAASPTYAAYREATEELQRVDLYSMSRQEKMAFFINVYNALVVHGFVAEGTPSSFFDRLFFYSRTKYHIDGHDYSLDDIEHGVLRGNRPKSASLLKQRPFGPKDPRRFHAIPPVDPRIHFALNCGAKSCPPIKLYTPENLDEGLEGAASAFVEGEVDVDGDSGAVTLSKIMDWYKEDFGSTPEERLKWLLPYLPKEKSQVLAKLIKKARFTIQYSKYDWAVNE
ncbi:hypothetical protein KFL_000500130 [Klebsormidium nitens]|uniref:DEP domain-containing protein n=1 Tax=Klebsormidium nitens TaxID=105231 RepID=A0A1Y1HTC0_KLENI|nr:hypothetical protein KFL_000500130 [Klebsormidium nitens]|eukprot:GAQ80261.1 hypothetical protein KFL_000500130 [Klebsormidium nitens]